MPPLQTQERVGICISTYVAKLLNNKKIIFYNKIVTKAITTFQTDKYFHKIKFYCQDHRYTIVHFLSNKYIHIYNLSHNG